MMAVIFQSINAMMTRAPNNWSSDVTIWGNELASRSLICVESLTSREVISPVLTLSK